MPQCPTCGSNVSEQADVCPDCGMDLTNADSPVELPSSPPSPPTPGEAVEMPAGDANPVAPPSPPSVVPPEASPAPEASPTSTETPEAAPLETAEAAPAAPPLPPSNATSARLALKRGGALTGDLFPLTGRVIIGRFDPESGPVDIDLGPLPEGAYISRHHTEIRIDNAGGWLIRDLGSRNGTFIRPAGESQFRRVTGDEPLQNGVEVALGNARFEFQAD